MGGDYERERARKIRMASGNLGRAMHLMRSRDPQAAEDGFALVRDMAGQHVDELIDAFGRETDHGVRCWLLELIGDARSPRAFDVLATELLSDDESFSFWAERGLRLLDTREARRLLWQRGAGGPSAARGSHAAPDSHDNGGSPSSAAGA
ncbi:HEAT repeat domain-containing protein [Micromonospora sp. NPDC049460]|uniref:HEAT repeat domain-containing protein n=1 Tax=Micromonospora sp. NPDC049460 TaxID=3364272 RepID=UPI00378C6630